jgi:hypothetical protein
MTLVIFATVAAAPLLAGRPSAAAGLQPDLQPNCAFELGLGTASPVQMLAE